MTEENRDIRVIETYFNKIDMLVEVDYGDFKRKAGHYLLRLQDSLAAHPEPMIRETINKLHMDIIHNPHQDIETAREQLLAGLTKIRKFFQ